MIHILGYEIKHWKQMSASACFKTIVKTKESSKHWAYLDTKEWVQVEENLKNYVTIKQQSSSRSIQSKLSLKTSDQAKIRSGSHNSQSETADLYKRWILRWGNDLSLTRVSFVLNFNQISIRDTWNKPK